MTRGYIFEDQLATRGIILVDIGSGGPSSIFNFHLGFFLLIGSNARMEAGEMDVSSLVVHCYLGSGGPGMGMCEWRARGILEGHTQIRDLSVMFFNCFSNVAR